jgi:hypothetical protein
MYLVKSKINFSVGLSYAAHCLDRQLFPGPDFVPEHNLPQLSPSKSIFPLILTKNGSCRQIFVMTPSTIFTQILRVVVALFDAIGQTFPS